MCMIDGADDDWVNLGSEMRRARKEHQCFECSRVIAKGEQYEVAKGKSDFGIETYKTCAHCVWARSWLLVECNGFLFGGVEDDLRDHWDENWELRSVDLGRRILGMRARWRRRDGALMAVPMPSFDHSEGL